MNKLKTGNDIYNSIISQLTKLVNSRQQLMSRYDWNIEPGDFGHNFDELEIEVYFTLMDSYYKHERIGKTYYKMAPDVGLHQYEHEMMTIIKYGNRVKDAATLHEKTVAAILDEIEIIIDDYSSTAVHVLMGKVVGHEELGGYL